MGRSCPFALPVIFSPTSPRTVLFPPRPSWIHVSQLLVEPFHLCCTKSTINTNSECIRMLYAGNPLLVRRCFFEIEETCQARNTDRNAPERQILKQHYARPEQNIQHGLRSAPLLRNKSPKMCTSAAPVPLKGIHRREP